MHSLLSSKQQTVHARVHAGIRNLTSAYSSLSKISGVVESIRHKHLSNHYSEGKHLPSPVLGEDVRDPMVGDWEPAASLSGWDVRCENFSWTAPFLLPFIFTSLRSLRFFWKWEHARASAWTKRSAYVFRVQSIIKSEIIESSTTANWSTAFPYISGINRQPEVFWRGGL